MKCWYLVESAYQKDSRWTPSGVWVLGGGRIIARFLPGNDERNASVQSQIQRMTQFSLDTMEYIRDRTNIYTAVLSDIIETEDYESPEQCAAAILRTLAE